jgi:hypothetical protein
MLRHEALVRTDVLEELSASFIRVTRIGELGTTLAVTSHRHYFCAGTNLFQNAESKVPSQQQTQLETYI